MFRNFLITVLGFIAGAVVTYLVVVFGVSLIWDWQGVHDQDGGGAMTLGLVIGPVVAVIGGIISAVIALRIALRRKQAQAPLEKRRDIKRLLILGGAVLGAYAGYQLVLFGFWLARPISLDSYWIVWMLSWLPTIIAVLGAVVGGVVVHRMAKGK